MLWARACLHECTSGLWVTGWILVNLSTTQSKWGLCLTEVSNSEDTQASVSVLLVKYASKQSEVMHYK